VAVALGDEGSSWRGTGPVHQPVGQRHRIGRQRRRVAEVEGSVPFRPDVSPRALDVDPPAARRSG
jgi:hypothetical protein